MRMSLNPAGNPDPGDLTTATAAALTLIIAGTLVTAVFIIAGTLAIASAATTTFRMYVSVGQFLLGSTADIGYLTLEKEIVTGHGMIEIHLDSIALNGNNLSIQASSFCIHHWNHGSNLHQAFIDLTIHLEDRRRNVHNGILHYGSVGIFAVQQELKTIAAFQAIQVLLKFGKQSTCSKKKGKGILTAQ